MDGLEIKLRRVRAGLTLYALGQLCGVHPSRLSEMERGQRKISEHVLEALNQTMPTESIAITDVEA